MHSAALPNTSCQVKAATNFMQYQKQESVMTEQHADSQWGTVEYLRQVSTLNPVQQIKQLTMHMLDVQSGQRILDLGCGYEPAKMYGH